MGARRRACEACHVLKARCEPCDSDQGICGRCWRLGKECVPAARRLQRDRIAELEAQVELLTKALQSQGLTERKPPAEVKKRKLSTGRVEECKTTSSPNTAPALGVLEYIDENVPKALQQQVLDAYSAGVVRVSPYVQKPELDLQGLRSQLPMLLLTILAFPTTGILDSELQHDMAERAIAGFQAKMLAAGERSLELVQSLLLASFWFRAKSGFKHATVLQLIYLAVGLAADLGIGGPQATIDPGALFDRMTASHSLEARRTWLSCFVASSGMTTVMRRPDSNPWTFYHNECLNAVRSWSTGTEDRLFCQIVVAEQLCQRIMNRLEHCDVTRSWDLADHDTELLMSQLRLSIEDWATKIPSDLLRPELLFYQQIALIYLHEPVLHTQLNKSTFSAPFIAGRMTPADFACPTVTVNHVTSLYAIKDACHAALNLATSLNANTLLSTSSLSYVPRILYSIFVLLKLYVATTAHGNTYGVVLSKDELHIQYYFNKMKVLAASLEKLDSGATKSFHTYIIGGTKRLEEWFHSYEEIVERYEQQTNSAGSEAVAPAVSGAVDELSIPTGLAFDLNLFEDDYMFSSLFMDDFSSVG